MGFEATATASRQAHVCLGDKESGARCNYDCDRPCSHERIGFYLFGGMTGNFAWGQVPLGGAPSKPTCLRCCE